MDEYVKEALDLVKAQAGVRNMSEDEITSMVQSVADRLRGLEFTDEGEGTQSEQEPSVDPKKSIREKSVICLERGKSFKILSKKHLATHGLTPHEYKEKWGFKKNSLWWPRHCLGSVGRRCRKSSSGRNGRTCSNNSSSQPRQKWAFFYTVLGTTPRVLDRLISSNSSQTCLIK